MDAVTIETKVELTRLVDGYEGTPAERRSSGESERLRLDSVGDWTDASSAWALLSDPWRPKQELYTRLARARAETLTLRRGLPPIASTSTLYYLPEALMEEAVRRGNQIAKAGGDIIEGLGKTAKGINDTADYVPLILVGTLVLVVLLKVR